VAERSSLESLANVNHALCEAKSGASYGSSPNDRLNYRFKRATVVAATNYKTGDTKYSLVHDQLPPLGESQIRYWHLISLNRYQLYAVIVANGCGCTQGPFWLSWRIAPVGREIRIETMKKLPDVRSLFSPFLPTPPLWPPKLEYNAVSAEKSMKFGNIVQGENLMIFDKDRDTAKLWRKAITNGGVRYDFYVQLVVI